MAHADPVLDQHEVSSNRLDDPILDALEPKPLLIDCLQNEILMDTICQLHDIFTSRVFVAICRGFWDRMGQVTLSLSLMISMHTFG